MTASTTSASTNTAAGYTRAVRRPDDGRQELRARTLQELADEVQARGGEFEVVALDDGNFLAIDNGR